MGISEKVEEPSLILKKEKKELDPQSHKAYRTTEQVSENHRDKGWTLRGRGQEITNKTL